MNIFLNEEQRLRAGWRLLVQLIMMFLCVGFSNLILHSFWSNPSLLLQTFSSTVGITFSIWLAARLLDQRPFQEYGLELSGTWIKDFMAGAAVALLAISAVFLLEWKMQLISISGYGWDIVPAEAFSSSFISYFLVMLMVGFYEELLSRGYQVLNLVEGLQYKQIGRRGSVYLAVLLTSTIFALLHLYNPNASLTSTFNIIIAGIILAVPFIITGKLGVSAGLHFGWNFGQGGIFGFPVSGINFDSPAIQIQQQGSVFWTGGSFGPEAGMAGLFGMAIMLGASCVYLHMAGYKLSIDDRFLYRNRRL